MKQGARIAIAGAVIAALAAAGGYSIGRRGAPADHGDSVPVVANATAANHAKKVRKLLYYRNPMGLPDTSTVPKTDPMGMPYIPVYEGEDDPEPASANQIRISTEKIQRLGVKTEAASMKAIDKVVRAAGRIEPDERRVYAIAPKFEGYVERLLVGATGQSVAKGQPLFEVYSPELVSAQREYAIAAQGVQALDTAGGDAQAGMKQLADSSLMRLKNWDISDEQIKALTRSGDAKRTMTFRSPVSGIVTEKKALQGMRFMPGETLYQITDLSSVWVLADVFEQDIGLVKAGAKASVTIDAYPGKVYGGRIAYVYPTLKAETRTVQVRIELANPGQLIKPGMFAQVELAVTGRNHVVSVPVSAVIDSGTRHIVLVQAGQGRFEPREVKTGARSDDDVEVLQGIADGERVVVAANFLIDAESNLKAVVAGFGQADRTGSKANAGAPAADTPTGH
ncbi:MAG TPA: efflux RND transporter periplasmic adaptor subunit [Oxalobacteraceae bacterium]|jgi:Cu(I)/Ag(I) efflux system membrane fusion protein|nr:efflux RND transporter periplasmic adaptor subunit [Oxalobacteraceae bacterium]